MLSPSCMISLWLAAADPPGDGLLDFTQVSERFGCLEFSVCVWVRGTVERDQQDKLILELEDVWSVFNSSKLCLELLYKLGDCWQSTYCAESLHRVHGLFGCQPHFVQIRYTESAGEKMLFYCNTTQFFLWLKDRFTYSHLSLYICIYIHKYVCVYIHIVGKV